MTGQAGRVVRVDGPLVEVEGLLGPKMSWLVELGERRLLGEIVAIRSGSATVQAYEYTGGLAVGHPVVQLARPLAVRLGPDLLGGVFDGLLRPLADAGTWLLSLTADFTGHEVFYIVAPDTIHDTPSLELKQQFFPDVPVRGDLSGNKSFFDSSKAERMLGWKHDA